MKELAKQYDPSQVEDRIYQFWLDGGYFHTKADPDKKPYTIVMPPPNVTGQLHMGHAVDNTMQDILIRTKRMQGYAALWVPGTDHASIATEAKVVEAMRQEGLTKEMVGRDGFLERAWAWKTKFGNRIVSQLKKLGSSCDWERERFTLDEGCSRAVQKVFMDLYNKGLIYHGVRMINWCPNCKTSISDIVNEAGVAKGTFYLYFKDKYDLRDKLIAFKASQLFDDAHKALDAAVIPDRRYGRGREPLGRGSYGPVLFGGKRFLPDKAVYGQPARPALQALSGAHREAEAHLARLQNRGEQPVEHLPQDLQRRRRHHRQRFRSR